MFTRALRTRRCRVMTGGHQAVVAGEWRLRGARHRGRQESSRGASRKAAYRPSLVCKQMIGQRALGKGELLVLVVLDAISLLLTILGPPILEPNFDPSLLEIDVSGKLLSESYVRILRLVENALELS